MKFIKNITKWGLLSVILLSIGNVFAFQDDNLRCYDCPPEEAIISTSIAEIGWQRAVEGHYIDLEFNDNTQQVFSLHDALRSRNPPQNLAATTLINVLELEQEDIYLSWDWNTELAFGDRENRNLSLDLNQAEDLLAVGNEAGNVVYMDFFPLEPIHTVSGFDAPIIDVIFHPTENWGVARSDDSQLGIFTLGSDNLQPIEFPFEVTTISDISFHPNGNYLAVGADNQLVIWGFESNEVIHIFEVSETTVDQVLFHPTLDNHIFTLSGHETILWEWQGDERQAVRNFESPLLDAETPQATASILNADGTLLIAIYNMREVAVWDVERGELIEVPALALLEPEDYPFDIHEVQFSSDELWLMFGSDFGLIFFIVP